MGSTVQRTTYRPQATADSLYEPAPGILLNRYRVIETNNDGGFGSVFICWDTRLQRRVAIKRIPLPTDEDSPQRASSLNAALNEARNLTILNGSNTVTVHDFQSDERYSYLVMEYVDGMSLAELLARVEDGLLSFDECAHVVDSVASALSLAHENRMLHLDIKPANILIDHEGNVKLADFGMAKLSSATGYGGALGGTIGYMPPEQIEEDHNVDERTDIFALAVVVWESLTGSCPFAAQSAQKSLELIMRGPAVKLSRIEPELEGTVENTLLKALNPNPSARMATIEEFAKLLVPALGDPKDGKASLADLLSQAPEEPDDSKYQDLSLYDRVPWVQTTFERVVCAAVAGFSTYQILPVFSSVPLNYLTLGTVGVAMLSAIWPPLSGAMCMLLVAGALLVQQATMAFPLALVVATLGLTWWAIAGRKQVFSNPAMLVPAFLGSPLAGVSISGFALTPGVAFITGFCSYLFSILIIDAAQVGYFADDLIQLLRDAFFSPNTWILAVGCGFAALLCSLLSQRRKLITTILGQIVAAAVLAFAYVMCAREENASITEALDIPAMAVAVFLGATLCIASALMGQSATPWKGDDRS